MAASKTTNPFGRMSKKKLRDIYELIRMSRRIDDREIKMKRQNQIYFQISGAGHELPLICAGMQLDGKNDWFFTYYRDRALALTLGVTPEEMMLDAVGAEAGPASRGRQMPSHWGHPELNLPTESSCTGTQFLHAAGCAQVPSIVASEKTLDSAEFRVGKEEVVFVSTGDGTTSQGEFWESLNTSCNEKLPVLYLVEDNGWAISTPVEVQTPGGSVSDLLEKFPHLKIVRVDGCDVWDTWKGFEQAIRHIRKGKGPALVHASVVRPYSHSMSDSETMYRTQEDRDGDTARDPFVQLPKLFVEHGIMSQEELDALHEAIDARILAAADAAIAAPKPDPADVMKYIYSEDVDPCGTDFDTAPSFEEGATPGTMVDAINKTLKAEMRTNPRIVVFGEDVADCSNEDDLDEVSGKGGVFKVTHGLQREFGKKRVFNSPLAEANIIGRAIGMAYRGLKPVVEIQFFDYIWPAYQQLKNELATTRWRSGGHWTSSMVIRVPIGGYLKGGAPYHSQSGEVLFTHIPGLRVVMPSNAQDAAGLLRTAMRCDDPVLFLEPKHLYRQTYNKSAYPGDDYMIPFGKANTVKEGSDVSIITYGSLVQRAVKAARTLENDGISVEIIDLRSLAPYDWDAVVNTVKKNNKVIVAHEDHISFGYGAELAARIADELFEYLDGPVRRIGGKDSYVAYAPVLEDANLPQVSDIEAAVRDLHAY